MRPLIVVQSRNGSSRFPGKALAPLGGIPTLAFLLRRVRQSFPMVVATTRAEVDDAIEDIAVAEGVTCIRGSLQDVASRFVTAIRLFSADTVVRLTADCPLVDPRDIPLLLQIHLATASDWSMLVGVTDAQEFEVFDAAKFIADYATMTDEEKEHVTLRFRRNPDTYKLTWYDPGHNFEGRTSIDLPEQLDAMRLFIATTPSLRRADIIAALRMRPEFVDWDYQISDLEAELERIRRGHGVQ